VAGEAVEIARGGGFCGAVGRAVAKIRMIRHEDNPKIEPSAGPPARCAKRAIHYPVRTLPRRTFMGCVSRPCQAVQALPPPTDDRQIEFGLEYTFWRLLIVTFVEKVLPSGLPSPNCDRFVLNSLACWRTRHLAVEQT